MELIKMGNKNLIKELSSFLKKKGKQEFEYAAYDRKYVLGVDTLADFRRLGYASLLLRKVLNDAAEKDYEILWDCDKCNEASKKTAQSQNLVFDFKYKVCWLEL